MMYISFVVDETFAGGCIVDTDDTGVAITLSWEHKCNPGGQALVLPVPEDVTVKSSFMNRILTKTEIDEAFNDEGASIAELRKEGASHLGDVLQPFLVDQ